VVLVRSEALAHIRSGPRAIEVHLTRSPGAMVSPALKRAANEIDRAEGCRAAVERWPQDNLSLDSGPSTFSSTPLSTAIQCRCTVSPNRLRRPLLWDALVGVVSGQLFEQRLPFMAGRGPYFRWGQAAT